MDTCSSQVDAPDVESCYRAVASRDRRFDGVFFTAVRSTGIYCRPSCPARTPHRGNVTFHRTAAAAQAAGFRACKRCLPDATPARRAGTSPPTPPAAPMRLIADGVVDRDGVDGLAARLGYSAAPPEPPARRGARRRAAGPGARPSRPERPGAARDDRLARRSTSPSPPGSPASGSSTTRCARCTPPRRPQLRRGRVGAVPVTGAARLERTDSPRRSGRAVGVDVRIPVRLPFDAERMTQFLAFHLVPGVEAAGPGWYARTLRLPHGSRHRAARPEPTPAVTRDRPRCRADRSTDLRDVGSAIERCRRLLDADCDPSRSTPRSAPTRVLAGSLRQRVPGCGSPATSTVTRSRCAPCSGSRSSLAAANRLGRPARRAAPATTCPRPCAGTG